MNYKIKSINLKKERLEIEAKMFSSRFHRPLKHLSWLIYTSLLNAETSVDDWRWIGFSSKNEWLHDCKRSARHKHREIMKQVKAVLKSQKDFATFHIMNRLISDHYKIEGLKMSLADERRYGDCMRKAFVESCHGGQ